MHGIRHTHRTVKAIDVCGASWSLVDIETNGMQAKNSEHNSHTHTHIMHWHTTEQE